MRRSAWMLGLVPALVCTPAQADSARDMLLVAAYTPSNQATALARVDQALQSAQTALARNPRDYGARLQHALALSYRGKLTRSRSDLIAARREIEGAVAANPQDPEAQMALAGWHLGAVIELGSLLARTMLGARRATGMEALNRAIALGGDRPSIATLASLHLIQLAPDDVSTARKLADAATRETASSPIDRIMQKQAQRLLPTLRDGNGKAAAATAKQLMPFGHVVG